MIKLAPEMEMKGAFRIAIPLGLEEWSYLIIFLKLNFGTIFVIKVNLLSMPLNVGANLFFIYWKKIALTA